MVIEKIRETIKKYNMIKAGDGVIAGLSGGPDSVCMFHALCALREEVDMGAITAVHINHGLRGAESDGDEAAARRLAESQGAEFVTFRYDVARIAAESGESTEVAGRRLRYSAFERVRRKKQAARIAVAHNMNDQAETVLMRIMRGTGIKGLGGIDFVRDDGIVIRPVLGLTRAEIEQYCEENGLETRIDSTNKETVYTRNKIRLELLPLMQEKFNPNVVRALVRLSVQAREDEDFIMAAARGYAEGTPETVNEGPAALPRWNAAESSLRLDGFARLHRAVAKRVIMLCAERAGMVQNMSAVNLEDVFCLAYSGAEKKETDIADGFYARVAYGRLWFLKRAERAAVGDVAARRRAAAETGAAGRDEAARRQAAGAANGAHAAPCAPGGARETAALPVRELEETGSAAVLFGGRLIRMRVAPAAYVELHPEGGAAAAGGIRAAQGPAAAAAAAETGAAAELYAAPCAPAGACSTFIMLDFDKVRARQNVTIRCRMPGDRISPIGMKGSKKLQDYFVDRRIPKHLRDSVILIVSGGRVIAAGGEVSSECSVNAATALILSIEY